MDYTSRDIKIFHRAQRDLTSQRKTLKREKINREKLITSAWIFPEYSPFNLIKSNTENESKMQQLKSRHKHSILLGSKETHSVNPIQSKHCTGARKSSYALNCNSV